METTTSLSHKQAVSYCRLAFGPEAATRIWLIVGPDAIVLDRDGRCENYPFLPNKYNPAWREASLGNIKESNGTIRHRELRFISTAGVSALSLRSDCWGLRDCRYVVDNLMLSAIPQQAPVVHFDGPLKIVTTLERRGSAIALVAQVGIPGIGEGVFSCLSASIAEQVMARPIAELHFRRKRGGTCRVMLELAFDC